MDHSEIDDEALSTLASSIYTKVLTRLGYENDQDIPEYVADRLIAAIEWGTPHYSFTKRIAEYMIENCYELPHGAAILIRKHFDLRY